MLTGLRGGLGERGRDHHPDVGDDVTWTMEVRDASGHMPSHSRATIFLTYTPVCWRGCGGGWQSLRPTQEEKSLRACSGRRMRSGGGWGRRCGSRVLDAEVAINVQGKSASGSPCMWVNRPSHVRPTSEHFHLPLMHINLQQVQGVHQATSRIKPHRKIRLRFGRWVS